jgi:hypothetical protein
MVIWNLKFWLWRIEVAIEQPLNSECLTDLWWYVENMLRNCIPFIPLTPTSWISLSVCLSIYLYVQWFPRSLHLHSPYHTCGLPMRQRWSLLILGFKVQRSSVLDDEKAKWFKGSKEFSFPLRYNYGVLGEGGEYLCKHLKWCSEILVPSNYYLCVRHVCKVREKFIVAIHIIHTN